MNQGDEKGRLERVTSKTSNAAMQVLMKRMFLDARREQAAGGGLAHRLCFCNKIQLLFFLHLLLQPNLLVIALGGVEAQQGGEPVMIGRVFDDPQLDVARPVGPELVELLRILGDVVQHVKRLPDQTLAHDAHLENRRASRVSGREIEEVSETSTKRS
jgi:hypothetical protein